MVWRQKPWLLFTRDGREGWLTLARPPWPNGQGVGPLIRRLWVRVPQGVSYVWSSDGAADGAHIASTPGLMPFNLQTWSTASVRFAVEADTWRKALSVLVPVASSSSGMGSPTRPATPS